MDTKIDFEIVLGDDSDDPLFISQNEVLDSLPGVVWHHHKSPLGRSRNRNELAKSAKNPYLLFIDGDAELQNPAYISTYLKFLNVGSPVVCGGTLYHEKRPHRELVLRWKYGCSREMQQAQKRNTAPYHSFSTFQFLIEKTIFEQIRFEETLDLYGHEDTLFGLHLKKNNIPIIHIDNGLFHSGLDPVDLFIKKSCQAINNLQFLYDSGRIEANETNLIRLLDLGIRMRKSGFKPVIRFLFQLLSPLLHQQLRSSNPSLVIFDLYKLGYLSTIG